MCGDSKLGTLSDTLSFNSVLEKLFISCACIVGNLSLMNCESETWYWIACEQAGCVGGAAGVGVGHPFDTIKVCVCKLLCMHMHMHMHMYTRLLFSRGARMLPYMMTCVQAHT